MKTIKRFKKIIFVNTLKQIGNYKQKSFNFLNYPVKTFALKYFL